MKYRVEVAGHLPSVSEDQAIKDLSKTFNITEAAAADIVDGTHKIIKRGLDLQTAARYEAAITKCGCFSRVEPDEVGDLSIDGPAVNNSGAKAEQAPSSEIAKTGLPEYYRKQFRRFDRAGGSFKPSFNIAALLFGFFWYFYRGLWAKGALLAVAIIASGGVLFPFSVVYSVIAANYDLYLWRRYGTQMWSRRKVVASPVFDETATKHKPPQSVKGWHLAGLAFIFGTLAIAYVGKSQENSDGSTATATSPLPGSSSKPNALSEKRSPPSSPPSTTSATTAFVTSRPDESELVQRCVKSALQNG